jgi:hypothetical protein
MTDSCLPPYNFHGTFNSALSILPFNTRCFTVFIHFPIYLNTVCVGGINLVIYLFIIGLYHRWHLN